MADHKPVRSDAEVGKTTTADVSAAMARAGLAIIPVIGPAIAEVVTALIPNQRLDRIHDLVVRLARRLEDAEAAQFRANLVSPEAVDILEDAFLQSVRAISEERRERMAALVARGLSDEDVAYARLKKLQWLLGELADPELMWLIFIGRDYDASVVESVPDVLELVVPHRGSDESVHDDAALQAGWRRRLLDLDLVERSSAINEPQMPYGDTMNLQVTQLGKMLLESFDEEAAQW